MWPRRDLLAGLTAAAVVPQAVAYALLGTSRPLSVSSTSTIAILTAGALADAAFEAQAQPGRGR